MTYFLAIDAGTSAMKAAVIDNNGRLIALDRQEYTLLTPAPNEVELDPEVYWQTCVQAVRNAVQRSLVDTADIRAVCISSQGETIIPIDAEGRPTRNAIIWLDNRAGDEAGLIADRFGIEIIQQISGQTEISPIWPACKILWIKRNEPEVFARSARFLLVEDYLLFRLTGQFVSNQAVHTSSLFLDIRNRTWWPPMFEYIGMSSERFGRLVEPSEIIGPLSPEVAQVLGLSADTLAVSGGLDQTIGAVGAGNISPGMVSETTGSALALVVTLNAPLFDPLRRVPCFYHSRPGAYTFMPWCQTAGLALRWFRDQFYGLEAESARQADQDPYDVMTQAVADILPGSDGLIVLPHLEGASCPEMNPFATGVFFGATLRHTRAHFVRAIMESVGFMLKRNFDLIETLGVPVEEIRSIGGGARNPIWLQIKADVLQKPIVTVENEEAACLGAALTAAVGIGYFPNLEAGVSQMVRVRQRIEPRMENAAVYRRSYSRYIELYDRLAPMFVQLDHC